MIFKHCKGGLMQKLHRWKELIMKQSGRLAVNCNSQSFDPSNLFSLLTIFKCSNAIISYHNGTLLKTKEGERKKKKTFTQLDFQYYSFMLWSVHFLMRFLKPNFASSRLNPNVITNQAWKLQIRYSGQHCILKIFALYLRGLFLKKLAKLHPFGRVVYLTNSVSRI